MLLIELIWLIDVLNIKGFEFLDTTFGFNTLFWSIIFIFIFIKAIIIGSKEYREKQQQHEKVCDCSSYKKQIEYLEKRNDKLHEDLISVIHVRDEYKQQLNEYKKDTSHIVNQLETYQKRHEYDMRKRKELEEELEKYKK